jgi:hypothetical protein
MIDAWGGGLYALHTGIGSRHYGREETRMDLDAFRQLLQGLFQQHPVRLAYTSSHESLCILLQGI